MRKTRWLLLVAILAILLAPSPAFAYIGPGAGFALAGSFFAVFLAICSAILMLLTWPVRLLWRAVFGRRALARSRFKRVVVLGLDGLDYRLTEQMLAEGKLPHLEALRKQGCFKALGTTLPPISPVAWSSFQTGTNPGKHNIYDFLTPDRNTYEPRLSSVENHPPRRILRLGKYQLPLGKAEVRLLRKSRPFWAVLGDYGIFSSVLRVPITYPPERLRGVLLSAMCVPDLRGTQGMFSFYTTRPPREGQRTGGEVHRVVRDGNTIRAELIGPENPLRTDGSILKVPFVVTIEGPDRARLKIDGQKYTLRKDAYTNWIRVAFRAALGMRVYGLCRFLLLDSGLSDSVPLGRNGTSPNGAPQAADGPPEFGLYVTPINIDPEKPVMPLSWPGVFSTYLAKRQGAFATLGLAEDTWAVNEHVLADEHFLQQCLDADREREVMFFDALEKVRRGLCVVVFDGTDRLQHMFWRDIDPTHPARSEHPVPPGRNVIEDLYRSMDDLVARTIEQCRGTDTLLFVISDHGFNAFRRGIDLNRWLLENGYLKLHDGQGSKEFLAGVDWSQTRAFALGLAGIFLNLKDKYSQGIVEAGAEADALREEIAARLATLVDPATQARAIHRVYITARVYRGPYKDHAPDLIPGYERGYRVSWDTAIGKTTETIFHDNTKAWSGDHCIDPSLLPGVLFCNQPVTTENPRLMDIGPTILYLFGVPVPEYMDGKVLAVGPVDGAGNGAVTAASTQGVV
jgi:predicted AlkP superfamily phosphohydrolase/phosphomutase